MLARSTVAVLLLACMPAAALAGTIAFSQSTYTVGESATTLNVGFVRTGDASGSESVRITSSSASIFYPADIVEFSPGETARTFMVVFGDDAFDEDDEAVTLTLSNGATATVNLIDNDPTPQLTVPASIRAIEEDGSAVIRLGGSPGQTVSVSYQVVPGTATYGDDYSVQSGTAAGKTPLAISIPLVNDATAEPTETFTIRLSNPVHATLSATEVTVTLFDDDGSTPLFFIDDARFGTGVGLAASENRLCRSPAGRSVEPRIQRRGGLGLPLPHFVPTWFEVSEADPAALLSPSVVRYIDADFGVAGSGQRHDCQRPGDDLDVSQRPGGKLGS